MYSAIITLPLGDCGHLALKIFIRFVIGMLRDYTITNYVAGLNDNWHCQLREITFSRCKMCCDQRAEGALFERNTVRVLPNTRFRVSRERAVGPEHTA